VSASRVAPGYTFTDGWCAVCGEWWRLTNGSTVCPPLGHPLSPIHPAIGPPSPDGKVTEQYRSLPR
jgi:hypothetical protein